MYLKDSGKKPKYNAEMNSGKGVLFNGVDQNIALNSLGIQQTDTCTYCVRVENATTGNAISEDGFYALFSASNTRISFYVYNGTVIDQQVYTFPKPKSRYDVVFVINVNSIIAYVDNSEVINYQGNVYFNTSYKLKIASRRDNTQYFDGTLKDLYVFNDTLSQQEITKYSTQPNEFFQDVQDGVIDNCLLNMPLDGTDATVHDYVNNTDYQIQNYTTSCRDTTSTLSYGSQESKFLSSGLWRGYLTEYYKCVGSANMGYTPSGTFQIEEVTGLNGVYTHKVYSSDNSKYTNGVIDGTFIVPLSEIILDNTNIESIVIDEIRLFKIHTKPQDPLKLYNKAQQKGLLL